MNRNNLFQTPFQYGDNMLAIRSTTATIFSYIYIILLLEQKINLRCIALQKSFFFFIQTKAITMQLNMRPT